MPLGEILNNIRNVVIIARVALYARKWFWKLLGAREVFKDLSTDYMYLGTCMYTTCMYMHKDYIEKARKISNRCQEAVQGF